MATPQMSVPPPPPPAKKTSPIVWILVAVGGLFMVCLLAVGIGGWFIARKVKQVAGGNPASVVRMLATMNPDMEVVSSDEGNGKITIRNKKDGKVMTLNFEDVKNGKLSFQEDGKEAVSISGKDGVVEVKSADGTSVYGAGAGKAPAWVPAYPGSSPQGSFASKNAEGQTGSYHFTTHDGADKVSAYYQDALKSAGFEVQSVSAGAGIITAKKDGEKRTVMVTVAGDGGETQVSVTFVEKM